MKYGISNQNTETNSQEVKEILNFCNLNKIDSIDTAFAYGKSEEVLGQCDLGKFKITSKFTSQNSIEKQFSLSLRRLKLKNIYAYLAHQPREVSTSDWSFLNKLKDQSKVKKIGFSFNETSEVDQIMKNGFIPDIVQVPFNYLDNRFEDKIKELKSKYNVEIHTRSAFLQGLFFMNPNTLSTFFNPLKNDLKHISNFDNKAGSLLKYVISKDFIDKVVIGVNNLSQLEQNINQMQTAQILDPIVSGNTLNECLNPSKWPKQKK